MRITNIEVGDRLELSKSEEVSVEVNAFGCVMVQGGNNQATTQMCFSVEQAMALHEALGRLPYLIFEGVTE